MLRTHPLLWARYPDGDLAAMPERVLWELYSHARAERVEMARLVADEIRAAQAAAVTRGV